MNYICKCPKSDFTKHNFTYWEDRDTTSDEIEIIDFLENSYKLESKKILHIGIGNSYFAKKFFKNNHIFGITISKKEIKNANLLNLSNYKFVLCDKYSKNFKNVLNDKKFDIIIDTNLKSYSCCHESFSFFIENLFNKLNNKGMLITSKNGMKWFKELRPKLSFNIKNFFHFKLKEVDGNKENILTTDELKNLSKRYNLEFSFDDKLCYLKK
tara:strand:- start:314 stop:949 length:636 start_codon:yes stop_codon:yes gene_type:complete